MPFGLSDKTTDLIIESIHRFQEIEQVFLFGSRAMGNYKRGSDVDLAIKGKAVMYDTVSKLNGVLNNDQPLPYFFDVVDYESLTNAKLKEHIDREGVILYSRESTEIRVKNGCRSRRP